MAHSIGAQTFVNLRGVPGTYADEIERIIRPNVNGADFRNLGKRGQPFSLISVRDTANITASHTLLKTYVGLIGGDPLNLVWNSYDFQVTDGLVVKIMGVLPLDLSRREAICGGLETPPATGWLEARWDLVFVPYVAPP